MSCSVPPTGAPQATTSSSLSMAHALYCTMDMMFWLPETEVTLVQVEGR
jgi:hypothetical protein